MPFSDDDRKQTISEQRQSPGQVQQFYLDLAERPLWEAVYASAVRAGMPMMAARYADEAVRARRART